MKKNNDYLKYLNTKFNKKDNTFFIKKINKRKNEVILKAKNDSNLSQEEKEAIKITIEKINKEEIEELNKKDKWTDEEVNILLNKISQKYDYEINILDNYDIIAFDDLENDILDDSDWNNQLFECKNCDSKYTTLHSNIDGLEGSLPICNNCKFCYIKCCRCNNNSFFKFR